MLEHVLLSVIEIIDDDGCRRWSAAETLRTPESAEAG